jgi:hypothetical protein
VTVAQFGFWGNYLPSAYPTCLRGTGESFAANIGGRMDRAGGALVTVGLAAANARRLAVHAARLRPGAWRGRVARLTV